MQKLRAFHLRIGERRDVAPLERLIDESLAPLGVNVLVLECNDNVVFASHPELPDPAPGRELLTPADLQRIADAGRASGVRVIPLFECLGHQGWGGGRNRLLRAYPEFDETPHVPTDAQWPDFYCPSWCPSHPDVNGVAFDLLDELIEACDADAVHVGLDEVYALADDACPRCSGKDRAELFAGVVADLHAHLVGERGVEMLMWADRLLDAGALGYSQWDADVYGTHRALERIPRDVVLCDWHYDPLDAYPSVGYLLDRGYTVWPSCWKNTEGALGLLDAALAAAEARDAGERMPGMLVTGWDATGSGLERVLRGEASDDPSRDEARIVATLQAVLTRLDSMGSPPPPRK